MSKTDSALAAFVLPDGHGGELFAVGCDDLKLPLFQGAFRVARAIAGVTKHDKETACGSVGKSAANHPQQLIRAIQGADGGRNLLRHDVDVGTLISGRWRGTRGMGIGSTVEKRKRAAVIALAAAIVDSYSSQFPDVRMGCLRPVCV